VNFFEFLWTQAREVSTPWVLLAASVAFVVSRLHKSEPSRFRSVGFFTALHLAALITFAVAHGAGAAWADDLKMPAWVFGAVAFVGAAATVLFGVALPLLRIETPTILRDVIIAIGSVVTAVAVAGRSNVNLSGLIATSAVLTAVLGFSLQDVIANVAGGLAIQVDNSIELGDWLRIGDVTGRVVDIRWRHTAVETSNWETVLIPNSSLMKSQVAILGRRRAQPRQVRRWIHFHVDWRYQPGDVIGVIEAALDGAQLEHVAKSPVPNCVLLSMEETYGRYAVRYWLTDMALDDGTDSEVRSCVFFALQRAAIPLALPAQAVFLTQETSDRRESKNEQLVQKRMQVLGAFEMFSVLSEPEREELARHLKYAPFARGEVLTRQGADAHWLYLVEDGEVSVRIGDGTNVREVTRLKGPAVFGEMSLLTGEPRSATVVAEGEVECFRLDKVALQRLITHRPEIAQALAEILSRRRAQLQAAREGLDAAAERQRETSETNALVKRIKAFFSV
jgi:small-conductance mechanosensitive channel